MKQRINPIVRATVAFAGVVIAGGLLWFDWQARVDGFQGYFDRRAAHDSGIVSGAEWRAMRAAGDGAVASMGGETCTTEACRVATAALGGRWGGSAGCASGNIYRFTDAIAEVTSLAGGQPGELVRRRYRLVTAPVVLRPLRDVQGRPLERAVTKLPGDIEVFTLGRSAYVRRIFRAVDADTIRLVLVEQRTGRGAPVLTVVIDGVATADGVLVAYRRCLAG